MNIKVINDDSDEEIVLDKVTIIPSSVNLKLGDSKIIQVYFTPDNFPKKTGKWVYDSDYIERITESNLIFSFTTLKEGTTQITYIPDSDTSLSSICNVNIGEVILQKIVLSPQNEISSYGKQFDINVSYIPNEAQHYGNWLYDPTKLKLYPISPDKGRFEVITTDPQMVKISYSNNDISDVNYCTIINNPAKEITLSPTDETLSVGTSFYIDIKYSPENSDKIGTWTYDNTKVRLLNDTDQYTKAHFVTINETSSVGTELTFMSGYVGATNTCYISTNLNSLLISPTTETVKFGDTFRVNVVYDPSSIIHKGTWDYDSKLLRMTTEPDNYEYAEFVVISDPKTTISSNITYAAYDKLAINKCTIVANDDLTGLSLTPGTETVYVGDKFDVNVVYTPPTAKHTGVWDYDPDYVKMVQSTKDVATFEALKGINDTVISFKSGHIKAINACTIKEKDPTPELEKITLTPSVYNADGVGETFVVSITFDPNNASHKGTWTSDSEYLLQQEVRIGVDVGVFRTLKPTDGSPTTITFTSENGKSDTCNVVIGNNNT